MIPNNLHKSSTAGMLSLSDINDTGTSREKLANELEDVFNKLSVEQAVV